MPLREQSRINGSSQSSAPPGTTCTRCGQVIQSVLSAFPPVETVDGWRHERCREVPTGPVPVEDALLSKDGDKCPFCDSRDPHRHDFVDQATPPAAPASEPAVRPLTSSMETGVEWCSKNPGLAAMFSADFIIALADRYNAARAEVEQLRGRLAEAEQGRDRAKDAFENYRLANGDATARVRSMRDDHAEAVRTLAHAHDTVTDRCSRCAVLQQAARAIRALPLDTGTATDASEPQADAIKAAVAAANNRAADAFRDWLCGTRPLSLLTSNQFEAWLRSGEDAPEAGGGE